MPHNPRTALRAVTLILAAAVMLAMPAAGASVPASPASWAVAVLPAPGPVAHRPACAAPAAGHAACLALVDTGPGGQPLSRAAAGAAGLRPYTPADLQAAYHLPSARRGRGQTIAIVDAYDDPHAAADLAAYRSASHLPGCAGLRCFRKLNQNGGTGPPPARAGWALEESLDLDMAAASCPNCTIVLIEASSDSDNNLGLAEDEAARLGAEVISNSYGGPEYPGEAARSGHYDHPGIVITAASGDTGFGVQVPAAYPTVIAAGGTSLYRSATARGWSESAWAGAGSGCSAYLSKPSWQRDRQCSKRMLADAAAVADPNTPVAVYDTYRYPGWVAVGGTSVAAPLIAGVYALAGNTAAISPGSYLYARHHLFDVTTGSNGWCAGSYLCTAGPGYDGPTGWGSPDGISGF